MTDNIEIPTKPGLHCNDEYNCGHDCAAVVVCIPVYEAALRVIEAAEVLEQAHDEEFPSESRAEINQVVRKVRWLRAVESGES